MGNIHRSRVAKSESARVESFRYSQRRYSVERAGDSRGLLEGMGDRGAGE